MYIWEIYMTGTYETCNTGLPHPPQSYHHIYGIPLGMGVNPYSNVGGT